MEEDETPTRRTRRDARPIVPPQRAPSAVSNIAIEVLRDELALALMAPKHHHGMVATFLLRAWEWGSSSRDADVRVAEESFARANAAFMHEQVITARMGKIIDMQSEVIWQLKARLRAAGLDDSAPLVDDPEDTF